MAYYSAKIKHTIEDDKGKQKSITEQYLVKGVSVTDVETKMHEDFKGTMFDFEVTSVTNSNIVKVIDK
tara:strand:- start:591 stop:794 length:204 start_codon:yes stop_codon:yes gene_type:complete